jgi:hypothetical protein
MWLPWLAERSPLVASLGARGVYSGAEPITYGAGAAAGGAAGAAAERAPKEKR